MLNEDWQLLKNKSKLFINWKENLKQSYDMTPHLAITTTTTATTTTSSVVKKVKCKNKNFCFNFYASHAQQAADRHYIIWK